MSWVETDQAPYKLVATHTTGGPGRQGAQTGREGRNSQSQQTPPANQSGKGAAAGNAPKSLSEAPGLLPPTPGSVDRSRPVFPYPLVARYTGQGSIDDAKNFVAEMPRQKLPETFDWYGSSFFTPGYEKW